MVLSPPLWESRGIAFILTYNVMIVLIVQREIDPISDSIMFDLPKGLSLEVSGEELVVKLMDHLRSTIVIDFPLESKYCAVNGKYELSCGSQSDGEFVVCL